MKLNVLGEAGGALCFHVIDPLLQRSIDHLEITHDPSMEPDLVIRSCLSTKDDALSLSLSQYNCPYVCWSGESRPVQWKPEQEPLFELDSFHSSKPLSVYFPHLVTEIPFTVRPPSTPSSKLYCASFAYTNRVPQREKFFREMRKREPLCFAFGNSCKTRNNPFVLTRVARGENGRAFSDFAFNIAMENVIKPGYITEKIGYAFNSGSVPLYYGADSTFFNPASFINLCEFPSMTKAAETVVEIWRDPHKYQPYLDADIRCGRDLADYEAVYAEYRPWQKPIVDAFREAFDC